MELRQCGDWLRKWKWSRREFRMESVCTKSPLLPFAMAPKSLRIINCVGFSTLFAFSTTQIRLALQEKVESTEKKSTLEAFLNKKRNSSSFSIQEEQSKSKVPLALFSTFRAAG